MSQTTELLGFVRVSEDNPREIAGIAVPYGVVSAPTRLYEGSAEIIREAFEPGAFAEWAGKANAGSRRMPFRPAHKEKPIGVVSEWTDTPEGLAFRGSIFETPAGDEYLQGVRAGLNGVSIEGDYGSAKPRRSRAGVVVHRTGVVVGLAGSLSPAYDGAYVSLRDLEDDVPETTETPPAATGTTETPPPRTPEMVQAARDQVAEIAGGHSPVFQTVRAEAVYGRDATDERGEWRSWLRDFYAAHHGDSAAAERQYRHNEHLTDIARKLERTGQTYATMERAGDVLSSEIPGAYPNDYLPGLFVSRILKGRPMGSFYDRFPISDGLPKIYAKASTATSVAAQASENVNPVASDFATTAVTVNPTLVGGSTLVSRQVVDGASPAAETMLMQDLYEAYSQYSEGAIKTAVEAAAGAGTAIVAATPYAGAQANVVGYYGARFKNAKALFVPQALYSVLLAQNDTTGRSLLPQIGAINSDGTTEGGGAQATILGAAVYLSWQSTVNVVVTAASSDMVIMESPVATFRYEQATGPAAFNIGVWAYLGIGARLGSFKVTAA